MPYSERVAEAYIAAKDDPENQAQAIRQGQFSASPETDQPVQGPKYRKPTKEEADQHIADSKAMMTIGSGALALGIGGIPGAIAGIGSKAAGEHFGPAMENHIRNSEWVPVYDNWTENDFMNEYGGR
jgi:hypothetical protein